MLAKRVVVNQVYRAIDVPESIQLSFRELGDEYWAPEKQDTSTAVSSNQERSITFWDWYNAKVRLGSPAYTWKPINRIIETTTVVTY